jgi:hypothetical protein
MESSRWISRDVLMKKRWELVYRTTMGTSATKNHGVTTTTAVIVPTTVAMHSR